MIMLILNVTTGDQHGARFKKSNMSYCISLAYYNKFLYGIAHSIYSQDQKLQLIVVDVNNPNSPSFTTYQQTDNTPFHSVYADATTQRLILGI